ncbi:right-handed parallel beta-helix repeat-containing protein [Maioricimonas sp. JC845]|uniref:right-handed parallel beta-helix repeat-containing protein n=1 Tax=Maioricimonas sp. JC845 TaxID=3232138 RepID=UPI0034573F89
MRAIAAIAVCAGLSLLLARDVNAQESQGTTLRCGNVASLQKAVETIRQLRASGDTSPATIEFDAKTYRLSEPIVFDPEVVGDGLTLQPRERGRDAGQVVLSGGRFLDEVHRHDDAPWRYRLPDGWDAHGTPRAVVIDGKLRAAARWPNDGYLRIEASLPDRRSGFTVNPGDLPADLDVAAGVCDLVLLHDWSSSRLPVASFDSATRVLKTVGPIGCSAAHYAIDHFEKQPRYWLEGHSAFADEPGEWYIDEEAGELVLVAEPDSKTPPNVVLPMLDQLLVVRGTDETPVRGLRLVGLTFRDVRFPMPAGGLAGAQATMHEPRDASGERSTKNRPMLDAAVFIEQAEQCAVLSCRFEALGGTGLWVAGRTARCRVERCRFEDVGGNGVNLGEDGSRRVDGKAWYQAAPEQVPTGNRIADCHITRCGRILPGAVAIWAPVVKGLEITGNHILDCPYTGISLGWIWSDRESPAGENHIHHNRIEYVMQVLSDGGGIYTLGRQPGSIIEENQISDIPLNAGRAESNGMFLDEGTTGFEIRRNTIRRIDRSPLRFHRAGMNVARENLWELATPDTPPVRYNNTPEENITLIDNVVIEPEQRVYLIGNSLTWDTVPSRLDGNVHWHVDCGKSLKYIREHPEEPCVATSQLWPDSLVRTEYDVVCVQPHYGTTLDEDVEVISKWVEMQPKAAFVIHTGWARHASLAEERSDDDPSGPLTHSAAYVDALLKELRQRYPERKFRRTRAMDLLFAAADDIEAGRAPFDDITDLYRDAIHMTTTGGRYLMHNAMRAAVGQPRSTAGFEKVPEEQMTYLNSLLDRVVNPAQAAQ